MIKLCEIRIKGIHNVKSKSYNLSNLTYLQGKNGMGKSTVLESIQLALLGYIPGKGETKEAIFKNCNSNEMEVELRVKDIDRDMDYRIIRRWYKENTSVKYQFQAFPTNITEEDVKSWVKSVELPIFNFNEFCSLTANKMKDWFLSFIPKQNVSRSWVTFLQKDTMMKPFALVAGLDVHGTAENIPENGLIYQFIQNVGQTYENVDDVKRANAWLKEQVSYRKGSLERCVSTIQTLIYHDDSDLSSMSEESIKQDLETIYAEKSEYDAYKAKKDSMESVLSRLDKLSEVAGSASIQEDSELKGMIEECAEQKKKIDQLLTEKENMIASSARISSEIDSINKVIDGQGVCPYSSEKCMSIVNKLNEYKRQLVTKCYDLKVTKEKLEQITSEYTALVTKHNSIQQQVDRITDAYHQKEELNAYIKKSGFDVNQVIEPKDYDAMIKYYNESLSKLTANARYQELIDKLTQEKYTTELEIECLKFWAKQTDANGLQSTLAYESFANFAQSISHYLTYIVGNDCKVVFNVQDTANSFSFGIVRDEEYIPYDMLSSGEKCLTGLALMCAISHQSEDEIKVILLDDLLDHLDDENLEAVFAHLKDESEIQFVFAGVKPTEAGKSFTCEFN